MQIHAHRVGHRRLTVAADRSGSTPSTQASQRTRPRVTQVRLRTLSEAQDNVTGPHPRAVRARECVKQYRAYTPVGRRVDDSIRAARWIGATTLMIELLACCLRWFAIGDAEVGFDSDWVSGSAWRGRSGQRAARQD